MSVIESDNQDDPKRSKSMKITARVNDLIFAETIQKYGMPLLKKRTKSPAKLKAIKHVVRHIRLQCGVTINEQKVIKKINNMRARIKSKISQNCNSKLSTGEEKMHELLLEIERENTQNKPVIKKDGLDISNAAKETDIVICHSKDELVDVKPEPCAPVPSTINASKAEDTIQEMTTDELQRLTLLKQYQLLVQQGEFYVIAKETMEKFNKYLDLKISMYQQNR